MSCAVRIILVNYKNASRTMDCIASLDKQTVQPECIYIIDNSCRESERNFFENVLGGDFSKSSAGIPLKWIWNEVNLGFAAACNQGIKDALSEKFDGYIWLLNNDTITDPSALENLLKKAQAAQAGITGSKILDMQGSFSGGVGKIHPKLASVKRISERDASEEEPSFGYVEGSSFLISPECLQTVGLLPEDYFLYFEETDYCLQAKKSGFKLAWAKDSVIHHAIASSTHSEHSAPFFIDCLMVRNRIHFALKHRFPLWGIILGLFISFLLRIKRMQWNRIPKILSILSSKAKCRSFILQNGGFIHEENM